MEDAERLLREACNKHHQKIYSDADQAELIQLAENELHRIDECDRAELFACALLKRGDTFSDELIAALDPQHTRNVRRAKALGIDYFTQIRKDIRSIPNLLAPLVLARVRAKLAIQELVAALTRDQRILLYLLSITEKYLGCPVVQAHIRKSKYAFRHKKISTKEEKFLQEVPKAIIGDGRAKTRQFGYWKLDLFYFEVSACIKTYAKIDDSKKKGLYLQGFCQIWSIPDEYKNLIEKNPKPAGELTLGIMVALDLIPEARTFRDGILPHVKKLKGRYPYLRIHDPIVENLLDFPTKHPEIADLFDLFELVDSFDLQVLQQDLEENPTELQVVR